MRFEILVVSCGGVCGGQRYAELYSIERKEKVAQTVFSMFCLHGLIFSASVVLSDKLAVRAMVVFIILNSHKRREENVYNNIKISK